MKTILTFAFLAAFAANIFGQYYGYDNNVPDCPENSLFNQTAGATGIPQLFHAWSKVTEIHPTTDNYSVTSPFNSIRFWGGWVDGTSWDNAVCTQSPVETFHIEIFNQDPSSGAAPVYSFDRSGFLTKVLQPLVDVYQRNETTYGYQRVLYEPYYQIDVDLGEDISLLNGWISIRNIYTPGRLCYFCIGGVWYCNNCGDGFKTGVLTQQSGGGFSGNYYEWPGGMMYMCLSHNGANFSGSPLRVFDPALFTWDGLADAWQDQGASAAASDNYTVANSFNKLTLWGGYGIGSYSSTSCTAGTTETFVVDIYTQNPATGGTPVQSLTKTATLTTTGYVFHNLGNQPVYKVEITFNPAISITSGWIRVKNVNAADRPCKFGWLYNSEPAQGTYLDGNLAEQPGGLFFNLGKPCPTGFAGAGPDVAVYYGYPPMASAQLNATGGLWYSWSPCYSTNPSAPCEAPHITVSPTATTTYTVTATNNDGCIANDNVTVTVVDVRCGPNLDKVTLCYNNKTQCVPQNKVADYLSKGATLGACKKSDVIEEVELSEFDVTAYPNPFNDRCNISVDQPEGSYVAIKVTDILGRQVSSIYEGYLDSGSHEFEWQNPGAAESLYFLTAAGNNQFKVIKLLTH